MELTALWHSAYRAGLGDGGGGGQREGGGEGGGRGKSFLFAVEGPCEKIYPRTYRFVAIYVFRVDYRTYVEWWYMYYMYRYQRKEMSNPESVNKLPLQNKLLLHPY